MLTGSALSDYPLRRFHAVSLYIFTLACEISGFKLCRLFGFTSMIFLLQPFKKHIKKPRS